MNYCRRCESDYEKPGTCNCFAEQKAPTNAPPFQYVPQPPLSWPPNVSFTCPICGKLNCYETHITVYTEYSGDSLAADVQRRVMNEHVCGKRVSGVPCTKPRGHDGPHVADIGKAGEQTFIINDHVREEAARRYKPEGVHVPPLTS